MTGPRNGPPGGPAPVRHTDVVVVGGGQAGLAMSWCLGRDGVDHVVLEAETAAHSWADTRWDAFTLVTPNWHCRLPGYAYTGPEPDGFMTRDEVVAWLAGYRASFDPPLREHTSATALYQREGGGFELTAQGPEGEEVWHCEHVVVATGGYQVPIMPPWAHALDTDVVQLESAHYRSPDALPPGAVLVVGTGQSGTQIAEDLHLAGRQVHLALGDAPRVARTYRGKDVMTWLAEMGLYDIGVAEYPGGRAAREKTNHYVTGRDGGRDIDLRAFALEGMRLYGMLESGRGDRLTFAPTLTQALDDADAVYNSICADIDRYLEQHPHLSPGRPSGSGGPDLPPPSRYTPVWTPPEEPRELDLSDAGVSAIIWAIGYRADYRWIGVGVFDGHGRPVHNRGVSPVPGLMFLGLPWQHTWGSGRFHGLARDAEHLAAQVLRSGRTRATSWVRVVS
ncbi:MSMEG_0569 family flavin-dependent oxidoreductase [Nocardioides sp.]|uniref:MSMEG_0569 family flavin-dependent oxidoreductase n=1 Tax=Nocardioides sp. TaxID=35761 RepID=UPI003516205D